MPLGCSASQRLVPFNQRMHTGSGDAAGAFADLDEFQLARLDQPVDGGARYTQLRLSGWDAIEKRVVGLLLLSSG